MFEESRKGGRCHPEAQLPGGQALQVADVAHQFVAVGQQTLCPRYERSAGLCQGNAPRQPLEEFDAERRFHIGNALSQR